MEVSLIVLSDVTIYQLALYLQIINKVDCAKCWFLFLTV